MMKISSISICGVLEMSMHSLNNEGGEGNQVLTRQVTVYKNGKLVGVNAISGDMFKHIQAHHLIDAARDTALPLCEACAQRDPNRISNDPAFLAAVKGKSDAEVTEELLKKCVVDDCEGILVTDNRNTARKSTVEFGWVVGIPDHTATESYFHVKLVPDSGTKGSADERNTGQNIFYRPANSGAYAVVLNIEPARISYNDYTAAYAVSEEERQARFQALLKSVLFTFLKPAGAMRNTQNPHISNFSGVISISENIVPAPTVSPLNEDYTGEIAQIADSLAKLGAQIKLMPFNSLSEFSNYMTELISSGQPFTLK